MSGEARTCGQAGCTELAIALYTWPGRDQAGVCAMHVDKLEAVAHGLGMRVQLLPLEGAPVSDYERLRVLEYMGSSDPAKGLTDLNEKGRELVDAVALCRRRVQAALHLEGAPMSYAAGTSVPVERSKLELDRVLSKAGATSRMTGSDDVCGFAFVAFVLEKHQIRLRIPMPKRDERKFTHRSDHVYSAHRSSVQGDKMHAQACRERWRCLILLVKAKLEAIAMGVSTAEREFMADLFLANGRTLHEELAAQLQEGASGGPLMLGPGRAGAEGT